MIPAHNPIYTTLYYRNAEFKQRGHAVSDIPDVDEYYPVVNYPRAEMSKDSAQHIADDFITLTCAPDWRMRARRAVEPGDIFTLAPHVYMFVAPDEQTIPLNSELIPQTDTWHHLHIVRLGVGWEHMRKLCIL